MKFKGKILGLLLVVGIITTSFTACSVDTLYSSFVDEIESAYSEIDSAATSSETIISVDDIPDYSGEPYVIINNNEPLFLSDGVEYDLTTAWEEYSNLDELGRCTEAFANVCKELMPTEEREDISSVTPTGWCNAQYDFIDNGGWVYNRCHLIGFQLTGENDNECNLITGTRQMNIDGMLEWENSIADYIDENDDNHVLYRVTPIFEGDNLLADGLLMEAYSVEDDGEGVEFCVFAYNAQDGVIIDYATGETVAE